MKKTIAFLMCLVMMLFLFACGRKAENISEDLENALNNITQVPTLQPIEIGKTIKTSDYEITLVDVVIGPFFPVPEGFLKDSRYLFESGTGVFVIIKNLQKNAIKLDDYNGYCIARVNYNDGYIYEAKELLVNGFRQHGRFELNPLDEAKLFFNIEISEDAYLNRDDPLNIIIVMGDGAQYQYQVSEGNYM